MGEEPKKSENNRSPDGRFGPHNNANPNGRPPKTKAWTEIIDAKLSAIGADGKRTAKEELTDMLLDMARGGDKDAMKILLDRNLGKPPQTMEQTINMPSPVTFCSPDGQPQVKVEPQ
jgi:hypothetical protein